MSFFQVSILITVMAGVVFLAFYLGWVCGYHWGWLDGFEEKEAVKGMVNRMLRQVFDKKS